MASTSSSNSNSDEDEGSERETRHTRRLGCSNKRSQAIMPRLSASTGGWLCVLLPLALASRYLHTSPSACVDVDHLHKMLTVAALGMCVETVCFFVYMFVDTGILTKCAISLLPGAITSIFYTLFLQTSRTFAVVAGFLITVLYQHAYISILRGFPYTFSFGEAAILVQGLALFVISCIYRFGQMIGQNWFVATTEFEELNVIMLNALMWLLIFCVLMRKVPLLRRPGRFYVVFGLLMVAVTCMPVTSRLPVLSLLNFIFADTKRIQVIMFYFVLVGLTCLTVSWQLGKQNANTRIRKIFHLLIVLVFVPGLLFQCSLLYMATGIAVAAFVVLELVRLLDIPPFAMPLAAAFESFKDEKDGGQLAWTPMCLLIGCSLPIWLTPCPCAGGGDNTLVLLSGILSVGVGDTAASLVGSKLGRNKWHGKGNTRSIEGSVAFVLSILLTVWLMQIFGLLAMTQAKWFATIFAALNSALVEAFTDQVDNLVLPLVFYILVGLA
ncbi:uncharacterized protein Dwil_GK19504 [Drosophila willistoni]|uniref:dolichol kinase n=1 Tax=Drosophila willistoni TaxID=7260 RepID=B4MNV0_DROWI|nr:dolichol kinase [Drosophila willistoni]EDW73789.2 uncharacterized protein Dwil_GK19504 [Drosophila willistoni]